MTPLLLLLLLLQLLLFLLLSITLLKERLESPQIQRIRNSRCATLR